ncbi:MAG TPA: carbamoyltransferase N-terminal domain-containing protein, partial [Blastocatellia bacterium]
MSIFYESLLSLKAGGYPRRFGARPPAEASNFSKPHPGPGFRVVGSVESELAPRTILGISASYHDSSASLIKDGRVVASVQEDRFTRRNHDSRFPVSAISFCLSQANLSIREIDLVAYYEEPVLKIDRVLQSVLATGSPLDDTALASAQRLLKTPLWLGKKVEYDGPVCFVQHHLSHAASAFFVSEFDDAACLVIDGVGEWATTSLGIAGLDGIQILEQIDYPHSLGLFYSALTAYLGFSANNDEYKVMALASYGRPTFEDKLQELIHIHPDGSFSLNLDYFAFQL